MLLFTYRVSLPRIIGQQANFPERDQIPRAFLTPGMKPRFDVLCLAT